MRDTGIDIDPAAQTQLFEMFSQVNGSDTRRYGGTGLGLAITRQLVEMMGGIMGVNSIPGQGSIFWFIVVVSSTDAALIVPPTLAPPPATAAMLLAADASVRNIRVLLVEDNQVNQQVALFMLDRLGYRVDVADNGYRALQALRDTHYDLVLMDLPDAGHGWLRGYSPVARLGTGAAGGVQRCSAAASASRVNGLDTKSSIPLARQASRSPLTTLAVMAITGRCWPRPLARHHPG